MNSFKKYEMFREMPQEAFDAFKYMYNVGHTGVFENIASVVKYAIAGLLGYIAYDQYDVNTVISVLSGISAFSIVFRKRLIAIIPSIIGAIKMAKNVTSSSAKADKLLDILEATKKGAEYTVIAQANDTKK